MYKWRATGFSWRTPSTLERSGSLASASMQPWDTYSKDGIGKNTETGINKIRRCGGETKKKTRV